MVAPQQPYPQSPPPPSSGGGTSKIVPVVVSAGLAVGVFAGLLFGLGTGEVAASSGRRVGSGGTGEVAAFDVGTEEYEGSDKIAAVTPDAGPVTPPVTPDGGVPATTPDGGTPVGDGSGSGSGSGSAVPAIKLAHVTFTVNPVGTPAKITVDGKPVEGEVEIDISAGPKTVEVVAKAAGFRDFKKKISIAKDEAQTIDLVKRPVGVPNGNTGRRPDNGGGKIDI